MAYSELELRDRLRKLSDDPDRRIVLARLVDCWADAAKYNVFTVADILSENSQALAMQLFGSNGYPALHFWGGFEDAERKLACFLPDYLDSSFLPELCADHLAAFRLHFPKDADLGHRDFLGSLLGVGISRQSVADILIRTSDGEADVIVSRDIAPLLTLEYRQASRYSLEIRDIALDDVVQPENESTLITGSVASLRLDALLSLAFRLSRSLAAELVDSGRVIVNGRPALKADMLLNVGAKVSCHGRGRFKLLAVKGQSRKGRTLIDLAVNN